MVEPDPDRLPALDDAAFEAFVRRFAETVWEGWGVAVSERTRDLLATVDEFAAFEHGVAAGDASTVVDFRVGRRTILKARLGQTSVLVYVDSAEDFESVVRLSAYRETQPPLDVLLADLEPHVERALGRRF